MAFLLSGVLDLVSLGRYLQHRRRERRRAGRAGVGPLRAWAIALAGTLSVVAVCAGPAAGTARADSTEPSILMDDYAFIYSSPAQVERNLEQVKALGVNTIKVSMVWSLIAPDPNSYTKPNFDATNPDAYPAINWQRYDSLVQEAGALGLKVYFQLTAPAPLWATSRQGLQGNEHDWSHEPNARDFEQFVQAVGERYSGNWPAPTPPPATSGSSGVGGVLGTLTQPAGPQSTESAQPTLPAVRMWGIWNEPNITGWLSPQYVRVGHRLVSRAPALERGLIDAGYTALVQTGHSLDTILIGETASGGETHTLPFLDALYCVNALDQPLTGRAASLDGCPTSGSPRQFVVDHPGLFAATGWAHHPYSFNHPPNTPLPGAPDTITLANLGVLERGLDRVDATYGEPTGMPIYITEWGYKSNPPNPYVKTSLAQQETWLDQGWFMSYFMKRVKSMAQELLYDQPPIAGKKPGSAAYWSNFDSGLEFQNGAPKPSLGAFRLPVWVPVPRAGNNRLVWAEVRPARAEANPRALLQFKPVGRHPWEAIATVTTRSPEGFVIARVRLPGRGALRLVWADPASGVTYHSRTVAIS